jgi:hypothetical protein
MSVSRNSDPFDARRSLPDFGVSEFEKFDPRVFDSGDETLDRFVLMLAQIFNDSKVIHWVAKQMRQGTPDVSKIENKVDPYLAQIAGFNQWIAKASISLVHEFVELVDAQKDVVRSQGFAKILATLPDNMRKRWSAFLAIRQRGRPPAEVASLVRYLHEVRNSIGYHYYRPKRLMQGYRSFFFDGAKSEFNEFALASIGDSLEKTRFYFADAAVQSCVTTLSDPEGSNAEHVGQVLNEINVAILYTVDAYLRARKAALAESED